MTCTIVNVSKDGHVYSGKVYCILTGSLLHLSYGVMCIVISRNNINSNQPYAVFQQRVVYLYTIYNTRYIAALRVHYARRVVCTSYIIVYVMVTRLCRTHVCSSFYVCGQVDTLTYNLGKVY